MSMTPIINGAQVPVPLTPIVHSDPNRGQIIEQTIVGAGDCLGPTALNLLALRIPFDFRQSGWKSELTYRASGSQLGYSEIICDVWQLLCNEIQKDILEGPLALQLNADVPGATGQIRDNYNAGLFGTSANWSGLSGGDLTNAQALLDLMSRGSTHYALSQYVLRHSTNVSNAYGANVADIYIENIYTTTQLMAEVGSGWTFPLPGRMQYKINHIASPTAQSGYLWGWRKLASQETTTSTTRIDITTEYWLEQWSTNLYTPHP